MNSSSPAKQIADVRKSKGLSQEKLAERASINLRTLQRIEKGETEPRGDTLRLIAAALEVPVETLFGASEKERLETNAMPEKEDRGFLQFMNLSALAFWVLPLGNIAVPMLMWQLKKDQVKGARTLAKRIINFQITWSAVTFLFLVLFIVMKILHISLFIPPIITWLTIPAFYVLNTLAILLASIQLIKGREKIFSIALRIVR